MKYERNFLAILNRIRVFDSGKELTPTLDYPKPGMWGMATTLDFVVLGAVPFGPVTATYRDEPLDLDELESTLGGVLRLAVRWSLATLLREAVCK